jgi:hypothetical protein
MGRICHIIDQPLSVLMTRTLPVGLHKWQSGWLFTTQETLNTGNQSPIITLISISPTRRSTDHPLSL